MVRKGRGRVLKFRAWRRFAPSRREALFAGEMPDDFGKPRTAPTICLELACTALRFAQGSPTPSFMMCWETART